MSLGFKFDFQKQDIAHYKASDRYSLLIQRIMYKCTEDVAEALAGGKYDDEKPFNLNDYPKAKKQVEILVNEMANKMIAITTIGVRNSWFDAVKKGDKFIDSIIKTSKLPKEVVAKLKPRNIQALKSFQERKIKGLSLSKRIWQTADQYKAQLEYALDVGLGDGKGAVELARDIKKYLNEPDRLFRRVRDKRGNLQLSKAAKAFHPGQGKYRSSVKNAQRVTRTEVNSAYRESDYKRWQSMDIILGFEVRRSKKEPVYKCKVCEKLVGRYPKTFKFTGWHPQCYSSDTEVYTNDGWKFFKDVKKSDTILTLNPKTYDLEYSKIAMMQNRMHTGDMIHFYNRSLDILVTPNHDMLVNYKDDAKKREFRRIKAKDCGKTQPIYRSSEWVGDSSKNINIDGVELCFNEFCKFMGYWLSDGSLGGSLGGKYEIVIAQQNDNRVNIFNCINNLGFKARYNSGRVEFNNKSMYDYLKQFGHSQDKFVPNEIKNSTKESIGEFLNAFISCDGHTSKPKTFVGNRGNLCIPKEGTRCYYTTSKRLSDDIGELILKIGKRPSFHIRKCKGDIKEFKNGTYTINNNLITISECNSIRATQYNKEVVEYNDYVYDLTLAKNNTMYIRRNGKCFWGSNCMCYAVPILMSAKELENKQLHDLKNALKGDYNRFVPKSPVTEMPQGYKEYISENMQRMDGWSSKPYFIQDNYKGGDLSKGLKYGLE